MCGICGFNWADDRLLSGMLGLLSHRGPDDEGKYSSGGVTLGHRRLSIIDLSAKGHQPMSNEDGTVLIVYNGEVYNYASLRDELRTMGHRFGSDTDTEVIIHAYGEWGTDCLRRFNGMWAFCIYDRRKNILFLARDRFGVKPLYLFRDKGSFMFSSEIPPLLLHNPKTEVNEKLVYDFLLYNITDHTNETFFSGITKLPTGSYCVFDLATKEMKTTTWWRIDSKTDQEISYDEAVTRLRNLLSDSVDIRLRSDVPVGTCLSGGLDSSTIVSLLDSTRKASIKTFSAVFSGFEFDETRHIDLVAKTKGVENYKITPNSISLFEDIRDFVKTQGEPVPGPSPYAQYCVMKLARENNVTVLLDGQGSDEILAGYHYFFGFYLWGLLSRLDILSFFSELLSLLAGGKWKMGIMSLMFLLLPHKLRQRHFLKRSNINLEFCKRFDTPFCRSYYSCSNLKSSLMFHLEHKLEHLLKWEDRNSMRFSREARVPFLDYRIAEFVMRLPEEYIIGSGLTKRILRDSMRGVVPKEILERRDKIGFAVPEEQWIASEQIRQMLTDLFVKNEPLCSKFIDLKKTRFMIKELKKGTTRDARTLWRSLFLELWLNAFFTKTPSGEWRLAMIK